MSYTQKEVQDLIDKLGALNAEQRGKMENRMDGLTKDLDELAKTVNQLDIVMGRRGMGGGGFTDLTGNAEHKAAFVGWVRRGGDGVDLRAFEASLSTLSDPDGGFLVPDEMAKEIDRLATDSVAMRRLATVKKARGEYKRPLSLGGTGSGWVGEKEARDETDSPSLELFAPPFCEIFAMPKATQKLLDMSDFDVEAWLIDEIDEAFTAREGAAFIKGNGVKQPAGIVDKAKMIADASWEYGKTGFVASGDNAGVSADALFNLQHALKPVYRQNGVWLMNDATLAVCRKLKDGEGNYIWRPGLTEAAPETLLGKPVEIDDNMPDIAGNDFPVAFGDFKRAYLIVDHVSGVRLLRDPFTEKGFVKFYVTKRVAAGVNNYQAVKFLKITK
jgi:HK97 family phage major capsid protein